MSDDRDEFLNNALAVEIMTGSELVTISKQQSQTDSQIGNAINQSEELLRELGKTLPTSKPASLSLAESPSLIPVKSWDELVREARQVIPKNASVHDILTEEEIQQVLDHHDSIGDELGWFQTLDRYDIALSVSAGAIAGLIDVLLVKVPAHPGFLGSEAHEGGWLSNIIKEKSRQLLR